MSNIYIGEVIKWVSCFGYGFIRYADKGEERTIYVHNSSIKNRRLYKGMKVRFQYSVGERGPIAKNVEVLENAKVKKNT